MCDQKGSKSEFLANNREESDYESLVSDKVYLYNICDVSSDWATLAVSFCYGSDTINRIRSASQIYDDVNMNILDATTFQKSLYVHVFENTPIEIDSALFVEYSKFKIISYPEITELYRTRGIGAVLWHYMKGERYIPVWPLNVEKEEAVRIYKELDSIKYVISLAFQHSIFFSRGEELTYWVDDKGFEIMEKARLEELAEKKENEGVNFRKDSVK